MKAKRKRQRKADPLAWRPPTIGTSGTQEWESMDGMFRKRHITIVYGVAVPERWQGWRYSHGIWRMVTERRSERVIDSILAKLSAELETAEE